MAGLPGTRCGVTFPTCDATKVNPCRGRIKTSDIEMFWVNVNLKSHF